MNISPEDLAVSKLLAGREKDLAFVQIMLTEALVSLGDIISLSPELAPSMQQRLANALDQMSLPDSQ